MDSTCKCGGHIGAWSTNKDNEYIYKNLGVCIDCGKNYILKDGQYKYLSNAEFRRITGSRRENISS